MKVIFMQNGCFKWAQAHEGTTYNVQRFCTWSAVRTTLINGDCQSDEIDIYIQ